MIASRLPGRPTARSVSLVGLALAGLLLSGCASLGIHPGSAAVVGDETLSMRRINTTTQLYCQAYEPQISAGQPAPVPMRYLRQFVAASLAQRLLGQQLADQYGVQPAAAYAQQVTKVSQPFASAPSDQRDAVVDVEAGDPYLQNVQIAVGQKLLAESGQTNADDKAALQRGQVATAGLAEGPLDQHRPGLRGRGRRRAVQGQRRTRRRTP